MSNTKARRYCFTWNNYTEADVAYLKSIDAKKVNYIIFGFEIAPTTGTPHLQGYVEFATPLAKSTVKSRLDATRGTKSPIHLVYCEGNRDQNITYVRKPESKDPNKIANDGTPLIIEVTHVHNNQGKRTDWDVYYEFLSDNPDFDDFAAKYPEIAIKYHGGIDRVIRGLKCKARVDELRQTYEGKPLRMWQQRLVDEIKRKPDDRKVIWYYDADGNTGKTWLSKLLHINYGAAYFTNGKTADISHAYDGEPIVVFDYSRSNEESINYGVIETIKNGMIFSGKYESRTKAFNAPHVIIMANFMPNKTKLSQDRWDIRVLTKEQCTCEETHGTRAAGNTGLTPAAAPIHMDLSHLDNILPFDETDDYIDLDMD